MSQPSRARFKSRPPPQTWMREIDMELRVLKGKVQLNNVVDAHSPIFLEGSRTIIKYQLCIFYGIIG